MGLQIAGTDAAPQVRWTVPLCKQVETATGLKVFGWGSVSVEADGALQVDHHRDIIEPESLEPAVYAFTKSARAVDSDHDFEAKGGLIESLFWSPEKAAAMGVAAGDTTPRVAWWVGFEVEDPATIARVKSGELGAFSIAYFADRVELDDDQRFKARVAGLKSHPNDPSRPIGRLRNLRLPILSLVTEGASKGANVVLFKARTPGAITGAKEARTMDLETILAKLSPEEQAVVKKALAEAAAAAPKAEEPKPVPPPSPEEKAREDERAQLKARVAELEAREEIASIKAGLVKEGLEFIPGLDLDAYAKTRRAGLKADKVSSDLVHAALVKSAAAIKAGNVLRTHGAASRGTEGGAGSWDEVYAPARDAALAKDPNADLAALQRELSVKHKDLYLAR
jgi:hypothetical protein